MSSTKTNARIGDGSINLTNVPPGQTVKFEITVYATGTPASVAVVTNGPRTISIRSTPCRKAQG